MYLSYTLCGIVDIAHCCCLPLAVIKKSNLSDSRRCYQCIKFLVQLALKCQPAKELLTQRNARWQWAVKWLKDKVGAKCQWIRLVPSVSGSMIRLVPSVSGSKIT